MQINSYEFYCYRAVKLFVIVSFCGRFACCSHPTKISHLQPRKILRTGIESMTPTAIFGVTSTQDKYNWEARAKVKA